MASEVLNFILLTISFTYVRTRYAYTFDKVVCAVLVTPAVPVQSEEYCLNKTNDYQGSEL